MNGASRAGGPTEPTLLFCGGPCVGSHVGSCPRNASGVSGRCINHAGHELPSAVASAHASSAASASRSWGHERGGSDPYRDDPRLKVVAGVAPPSERKGLADESTLRAMSYELGLIAAIARMIRPRCSAASRVALASLGGSAALDPACAPWESAGVDGAKVVRTYA